MNNMLNTISLIGLLLLSGCIMEISSLEEDPRPGKINTSDGGDTGIPDQGNEGEGEGEKDLGSPDLGKTDVGHPSDGGEGEGEGEGEDAGDAGGTDAGTDLAFDASDTGGASDVTVDVGTDSGPVCDLVPYYRDNDGDSFGAGAGVPTCPEDAHEGWVTSDNDCDDGNADIWPGAEETCDNKDNNCDNATDEGCPCSVDDQRPCGEDRGECVAGNQICNIAGQWGACFDFVGSTEEVCDNADNDCDDEIDEDFGSATCGLGICAKTVENCESGVPQACDPVAEAVEEICDGFDNDCDGDTDEDLGSVPCGMGACVRTINNCEDGTSQTCNPFEGAGEEVCDNADNDCDGDTDENVPDEPCDNVCGASMRTCLAGGHWSECDLPMPTPEVCDGMDNDCLGGVDNGVVPPVVNPCLFRGVCAGTLPVCGGEAGWVCFYPDDTYEQGEESLCDGFDNDCDGVNDENPSCQCGPGDTQPCGTDEGECVAGEQACVAGQWGACIGAVGPAVDNTCNGRDNDCDGQTDEDYARDASCGVGYCQIHNRPSSCQNGIVTACVPGNVLDFSDRTCDGIDDDCDGVADEDYEVFSVQCGLGNCLRSASVRCVSGVPLACVPGDPTLEICRNGQDDDCDGAWDEEECI